MKDLWQRRETHHLQHFWTCCWYRSADSSLCAQRLKVQLQATAFYFPMQRHAKSLVNLSTVRRCESACQRQLGSAPDPRWPGQGKAFTDDGWSELKAHSTDLIHFSPDSNTAVVCLIVFPGRILQTKWYITFHSQVLVLVSKSKYWFLVYRL